MRRLFIGLTLALGFSALGPEARAQVPFTNVNDPFFLYYGFYLPRQQAQSMQAGPEATINAITAARQSYASTNRSDMFDPAGAGFNRFDMDTDFLSGTSGGTRRPGSTTFQAARHGGNLNGRGVTTNAASRYNRVGTYHPTLRSGQSRNANVAVVRGRGNMAQGGFAGASVPTGSPGMVGR
ncbi:hypothetical protein TA3x_000782 [Tundrisphaera sp. TA3]|uniref:hypothetical protein n=1 Tax=Tundrisphaera sp. TA3 TaxID=3435775 RepID=UPI003EB6E849